MLPAIVNRLWIGTQWLNARRFAAALWQPRRTQIEILRRYVERNELTEFGRRYRFSDVRSPLEFRSRVPLSRFEDYIEAIERIRGGEPDVLTADRVRRLEPTSGTSQARKLIPWTASLQGELRRAVGPWLVDIARSHPGIRNGRSWWAVSPALPGEDEGGAVAVGFDSDRDYLGGSLGWLTGKILVDCDDLRLTADIDSFRRRTALRLLAADDLCLISVWHPSFFSLLLDYMLEHWSTLLDDVAGGREAKVHARRISELRNADPTQPATVWPQLKLISCWAEGHAEAPARDLQRRFANVCVQSKGLLATEGVVSVPWQGSRPLAVRSHFFEFLDGGGEARFAWELEKDATYSVVITTGGGLYRYCLDDEVRVDGFVGETPDLRFVGRRGSVSDLCGEKLSEAFVAEALSRLLPTHAPHAAFALLSPYDDGEATVGYRLYVDDAGPADWSDSLEAELARNPHYANCVYVGQLQPVVVVNAGAEARARFLARMNELGQRLGDIKPVALSARTDWHGFLGK